MNDETTPTRRHILLDAWEDGYIEERAWVEVLGEDDSPEKAIASLEDAVPLEDLGVGLHYYCNADQVFMMPRPSKTLDDGNLYVFDQPPSPCHTCDETGTTWLPPLPCDCEGGQDPDSLALHKRCGGTGVLSRGEQCGDCFGTTREGRVYPKDGEPWAVVNVAPVNPPPSARRFWLIEVGHDAMTTA
jgi:hypothetical protein